MNRDFRDNTIRRLCDEIRAIENESRPLQAVFPSVYAAIRARDDARILERQQAIRKLLAQPVQSDAIRHNLFTRLASR